MCADQTTLLEPELGGQAMHPTGWGGFGQASLHHGFFRNRSTDEDLLDRFGLSWWHEVERMLDLDRCLSVRHTERLLRRLKEREGAFVMGMLGLAELDQEGLGRRYRLFRELLKLAIAHDVPIQILQ
jgi:hypothetical protein